MSNTKVQEKIANVEDLLAKMNQKQFGQTDVSVNVENQSVAKGEEDFEITSSRRTVSEIHSKMRSAARYMPHPSQMSQINFNTIPDTYKDEEGVKHSYSDIEPDTPPPTTLPANISKEIIASGVSDVKWTSTKDLPRGMDKDIRKLANAVFSSFNIDKGADVVCVNSFKDNDFLNTPLEVNSVLGFLDKHAASPHKGVLEQDFGQTIQGYKPKIKLYHTPTMAYLAVFEPEGQGIEGNYVYAFKRKQEFKLKNEKKKRLSNKPT